MAGFHLLGWVLVFALVAAFVQGFNRGLAPFWTLSFLLFAAVYVALFYLNALVLLPRLYLRQKYAFYFGASFLLLLAVYFLKPFDKLIFHAGGPPSGPPPFSAPPPLRGQAGLPPQRSGPRNDIDIVSIVLFVAVWSASSVFQIVKQWRTSERRAMQAEADKIAAELSFLKAQINPHFLFNTLNNIYSLAISKSEHTADAVLKLSAILHYVTDEVKNDAVPLNSEVDCVRNFLALQQLRLSSKTTVRFVVEGPVENKTIAPLVLMTFIENAFKYGISNREACTVDIRIRADERNVHFYCRNRIFPRPALTEREGIGIGNAKKRLAYLYPEKYLLEIDTQNGFFTVDLILKT